MKISFGEYWAQPFILGKMSNCHNTDNDDWYFLHDLIIISVFLQTFIHPVNMPNLPACVGGCTGVWDTNLA